MAHGPRVSTDPSLYHESVMSLACIYGRIGSSPVCDSVLY